LPWMVPHWRESLRAKDLRVAVLLTWMTLVVIFFSLSTGKRGVYVLPAVPAFALLCAPYLRSIGEQLKAQRLVFAMTALVAAVLMFAVPYMIVQPDRRAKVIELHDVDPLGPIVALAVLAVLACAIARPRRGFLAFPALLVSVLIVVSFWVNPAMNDARSGREFIRRVEQSADPDAPLGLVDFKDQYLLNARRPVVHFGRLRWREGPQETMDAARWMTGAPARQLVVHRESLDECFKPSQKIPLGIANRKQWFLVQGEAEAKCVKQGTPNLAHLYNPPVRSSVNIAARQFDRPRTKPKKSEH
jgi:4-amino-4-deoxy-L-arabinose transferase-like glycosyltransferase